MSFYSLHPLFRLLVVIAIIGAIHILLFILGRKLYSATQRLYVAAAIGFIVALLIYGDMAHMMDEPKNTAEAVGRFFGGIIMSITIGAIVYPFVLGKRMVSMALFAVISVTLIVHWYFWTMNRNLMLDHLFTKMPTASHGNTEDGLRLFDRNNEPVYIPKANNNCSAWVEKKPVADFPPEPQYISTHEDKVFFRKFSVYGIYHGVKTKKDFSDFKNLIKPHLIPSYQREADLMPKEMKEGLIESFQPTTLEDDDRRYTYTREYVYKKNDYQLREYVVTMYFLFDDRMLHISINSTYNAEGARDIIHKDSLICATSWRDAILAANGE